MQTKETFPEETAKETIPKGHLSILSWGFIDTIYKFRHGYSTCWAVFVCTISRHECKKCGFFSVTQKMSNTQESCHVTFFIDYLLVNYHQSLVWVLYFTSTMMWLGRVECGIELFMQKKWIIFRELFKSNNAPSFVLRKVMRQTTATMFCQTSWIWLQNVLCVKLSKDLTHRLPTRNEYSFNKSISQFQLILIWKQG